MFRLGRVSHPPKTTRLGFQVARNNPPSPSKDFPFGTISKSLRTISKPLRTISKPLRTISKPLRTIPKTPPRTNRETLDFFKCAIWPCQDGRVTGRRTAFVERCERALGLREGGNMTRYSERHLDSSKLALFNNRELESLDIQFASLIVARIHWPDEMSTWALTFALAFLWRAGCQGKRMMKELLRPRLRPTNQPLIIRPFNHQGNPTL